MGTAAMAATGVLSALVPEVAHEIHDAVPDEVREVAHEIEEIIEAGEHLVPHELLEAARIAEAVAPAAGMMAHGPCRRAGRDNSNDHAVLVQDLGPDIGDDELCNLFARFGAIEIYKVLKRANGASTGQGFVYFETNDSCVTAAETMNGESLDSGPIKCRTHPITAIQLEAQTAHMK